MILVLNLKFASILWENGKREDKNQIKKVLINMIPHFNISWTSMSLYFDPL